MRGASAVVLSNIVTHLPAASLHLLALGRCRETKEQTIDMAVVGRNEERQQDCQEGKGSWAAGLWGVWGGGVQTKHRRRWGWQPGCLAAGHCTHMSRMHGRRFRLARTASDNRKALM